LTVVSTGTAGQHLGDWRHQQLELRSRRERIAIQAPQQGTEGYRRFGERGAAIASSNSSSDCGHLAQQEHPSKVNAAMIDLPRQL
jgi:hypothetical protein